MEFSFTCIYTTAMVLTALYKLSFSQNGIVPGTACTWMTSTNVPASHVGTSPYIKFNTVGLWWKSDASISTIIVPMPPGTM